MRRILLALVVAGCCNTVSAQSFTVDVVQPTTFTVVVVQPTVVEVVKVKQRIKAKARTRYLVSEIWCRNCKPVKDQFIAFGWPEENVITNDECKRRFGFSVPSLPYIFEEPEVQTIAVTPDGGKSVVMLETTDRPGRFSFSVKSASGSGASSCNCSSACTCGCQSGGACKCESPCQTQTASPMQSSQAQSVPVNARRYYNYGGMIYDLETYSGCSIRPTPRNPRGCGMCEEIRAAKSRYFAAKNAGYHQTSVDRFAPGSQSSSPADVVDEAIAIMQLTPADVLAELGSGDGLTAIHIVRETGCKVVGVENDPQKVVEARHNVELAGLSGSITIVEGDVRQFIPDHRITAVYAYLYPDLLAQITTQLSAGRVTVCPGHKADGLDMELIGQCWVRRESQT